MFDTATKLGSSSSGQNIGNTCLACSTRERSWLPAHSRTTQVELYLYEVESQEAAEQLMTADPYFLGNAIAEYHIAEWEVHGENPALLQVAK